MLSLTPSTQCLPKVSDDLGLESNAPPTLTASPSLANKLTLRVSRWLGLSARAQTLVGIHFGAQRIYALALRYVPAGNNQAASYQLHHMISVPNLEHQTDQPEQVVLALKQLRRLAKWPSRAVATAVSGSGVTTKVLHVSNRLPVAMLALHVQQAAMAQLSVPLAQISLDFEILKACEQHSDCDQVLLSAARTEQVQDRVDTLRQAGWRAQVVDIGSHALARAAGLLLQPHPAEPIAVVELEKDSLIFMVLLDGEIIYQRLQPIAAAPGEQPSDMASLVSLIARQLQLYGSHLGQGAPSHLLLCGGAPILMELVARLSLTLELKVSLADFSELFGGTAENYPDAPAFSTALGLALRRACHV